MLTGLILPPLLKPYQAQHAVSAAPNFFDERLLEPAKSIEELEKLAAQYPTAPAVLEKLGYVYAKEMKSPDGKINSAMTEKAVGTYRRIVELEPTRVSAINNLANILYTAGRVPEAITFWEKAVQVKPDFLDAHLNLGKVLYVQGRLKESAAHFEQVLKLDPKNNEAIVYLKRMVE
jgi:tetratricopeptide (TPR) repeat protein